MSGKMKPLSAAVNPSMTEFRNSGVYEIKMLKVSDVVKGEPFSDISEKTFGISDEILSDITENIRKNGFDRSQPICIWKEKNILVDGYTRLAAAEKAGIFEIPVFYKPFDTEEDAVLYAYERQAQRRNLTPEQIYDAAVNMNISRNKNGTGMIEKTAKLLGVSPSTVNHLRTIDKKADEETKTAVRTGKMSIDGGYGKVKKSKAPEGSEHLLDTGKKPKSRSDDGFGDISDSLEDFSGQPAELPDFNTDGDNSAAAHAYDAGPAHGTAEKKGEPAFRGSEIIMALVAAQMTDAAKMLASSSLFVTAYAGSLESYIPADTAELLK